MKRTTIILSIAASMIVLGCEHEQGSKGKQKPGSKEIRVETITAEKEQPGKVLEYSGIVIPSVSTPLSFLLPGMVKKIYVDEGDQVRKGQLLAELDKTTAESSYQMSLAMQTQAQDAYDRLETVYKKGSLPEIQWEEVKSKLEQVNSAETIAKNNLDNCTIKAPVDGIIGSRKMEIGSTVIPGISVINLINIEKVLIRISVPENEINKIKKGQFASVVIPAISQEKFPAKVEKIGVVANQLSRTYEVKLLVENPKLTIKPGMVCNIALNATVSNQFITVPIKTLLKDVDSHHYVFVIDRQTNTVIKTAVEVGEILQNNVQILDGISEGDLLITGGQHKVLDQDVVAYY
jgi:RND family efflux transporter MFP subunit